MKNPRNIFLLILACFILVVKSHVQGQQCINDASTNPLAPVNNDPLFDQWDNLWLNSFDLGKNNGSLFSLIKLNPSAGWTDSGLNDVDTLKMFNPFSIGATPNSLYLTNPANDFTLRDFHWEDGWELLYLGTGFYPNGDPVDAIPANSFIDEGQQMINGRIPYMVYYNRYTSIVRVFLGVFVPFGAAQDLTVDFGLNMSVDNVIDPSLPYNGIFRHLNAYDSPLDQVTTVTQQQGVNTTGVDFNIRKWYTYDFQVGYDPCTCQNPSVLDVDISLVESSTMNLYGRMITVEEPLSDAAGNPIYNQDFLTASSIAEQDPNGYILQKSLDGLIEDYKTSLEIYENELEDRKFGRSQWFKDVLQGSADAIIGGAVGTFPPALAASWIKKKKMVVNADTTSSTDGLNDEVAKYVSGASKALLGGGFNYLSSQIFGDNKTPVRPSRPVANFSEMRFTGKIEKSNTSSLSGFLTPGSNMNGMEITGHNYPAYNEILGLYATLSTPEVEHLNRLTEIETTILENNTELDSTWSFGCCPSPCFVGVDGYYLDSILTKVQRRNQDFYFKLKNPLHYALNSAVDLNMEKTKVYLSYLITLENGDLFSAPWTANYESLDSLIVSEDEETNLWLRHDIAQSTNPYHRKLSLSAGWYEIENTANLLFGSSLSSSLYYKETFEYFTPYCGGDPGYTESVPIILSSGLEFEPVRVEVKVMADMYFDQLSFTGEEINTTQVFTYLLKDTEQGIDLIAEQGNYITPEQESAFLKMYPGELTIESDVISEGSPEFSYMDDDIVIAAESVVIDKNVKGLILVPPSSGIIGRIEAYDQIHLKPGAHLEHNLNLTINKNAYGASSALPATQSELSSFCSSSNYNAQSFEPSSFIAGEPELLETSPKLPSISPENVALDLYPNPARSELTLRATGGVLSRITIYDTSGRPVMQANAGGGASEHRMDIGAIAPGIYIVQATCGDEVHSEKLVVAR